MTNTYQSKKLTCLPLDCVGVILRFISSTKTFFKCYCLSKSMKHYFDNVCPFVCENILFTCKKSIEIREIKKYVINIDMPFEILDLEYFPNLKNLHISGPALIVTDDVAGKIGRLEHLESYKGNIDFYIFDHSFMNFSKLKRINVSGKLGDGGLSHFKECEVLKTNSWILTGSGFKDLKNLKIVDISFCDKILNSSLEYLSDVKELNLSWCYNIDDNSLSHFNSIEKLEGFELYNVTDLALKKLPPTLKSFLISCNSHITNDGIVSLKNLEEIKYPLFENRHLTCEFIPKLQFLKKLKTEYLKDEDFKYFENLKHFEYLHIKPVTETSQSDIEHESPFITDLGLKNISIYCKLLKTLILSFCNKITTEGGCQHIVNLVDREGKLEDLRIKRCKFVIDLDHILLKTLKVKVKNFVHIHPNVPLLASQIFFEEIE